MSIIPLRLFPTTSITPISCFNKGRIKYNGRVGSPLLGKRGNLNTKIDFR